MIRQRDLDALAKEMMAAAVLKIGNRGTPKWRLEAVLAAAGHAHQARPAPAPVKSAENKRRVSTEGDSGDDGGSVAGVFYD